MARVVQAAQHVGGYVLRVSRCRGVVDLEDDVSDTALADMHALGVRGIRINVSPDTVGARGVTWADDPIGQLLAGINPRMLTIDVQEASLLDDPIGAAASLRRFRDAGGRVCLDDFARGVSGLNLLRHLPLDEVRIDRLALDSITSHPHDRATHISTCHEQVGQQACQDGQYHRIEFHTAGIV